MSNNEGDPSQPSGATGSSGSSDERDSVRKLRAAKEYAEAIVATLHEPLLVLTPDFRVESANPAFYSLFQVTPEETEGERIYRLGRDQWDIPELRRLLEEVLTDGNAFDDFEVTHEFESIGRRTMLVNARPVSGAQSILLGVRDITESKRAEDALRTSEQRYRTLFEAMDEAYAVVEVIPDREGTWVDFLFLEVNPAFIEHTGMEYPVGRTATQLLGTPNPRWAEVYGEVAETGVPVRFEEAEMTLGRTFDLYVFRLGGPGSRRVAVLFSDIAERKRAEEALRASEEKYRSLFESIDEGFCIVEVLFDGDDTPVDYRFLEVNPAFERHTGLTDAAGKRMRELEPRHEEYWFQVYGEVAKTGASQRFRNEAKALGGRWFDVNAFRVGDPEQRQVAIIFSDVTARKRAEEELRESEERFRAFVTTSSNVVYRMSPDWTEMRALEGQGFLSDMEKPSTRWPDRYIHPDDQPYVWAAIEEAVRTRSMYELEHRVLGADGAFGWTLSRAVPLLGDDGEIVEWFGAARDITERKEAEEGLRRLTETLEARVRERTREVRTLASWVLLAEQRERERIAQLLHDDVQQTLHSLNIRIHNLFTQHGLDRENNEEVAEAFTILRSAVRGTRSLSAVINPPVLQHGGLSDALRWLADHMREWHELSVAVHLDLAEPVEIDEVRRLLAFHSVRELLFNVVKHAGVQHAELAARLEGDELVLVVRDEGKGFDVEEALARKPAGFGLATIRERVRFHGGELEVDSTRGTGTRKTLRLPVA